MTKSEAGRLGGLSTFNKYGKKHMKQIGKAGAKRFWELYTMKPYGHYQWAIVRRSDNVIIGFTEQWRM